MGGILGIVWGLLRPLLVALGISVEKALFDVVLKYVEEVQSNPELTNEEKREFVVYTVQHETVTSGNKYADHVIRFAIEIAVAHLKKNGAQTQPAKPVVTPAPAAG